MISIRRRVTAAGLAVALFALSALIAAPAFAHAAYSDSDPQDKETVDSPPEEVWAEFTEPVVDDSKLEVFDPCGRQVDHGDSVVTGYRITVGMSGEAAGLYTVRFAVVSAVDGHPTNGEFTFEAGNGAPCPGSEPASTGGEQDGSNSASGQTDGARARAASDASAREQAAANPAAAPGSDAASEGDRVKGTKVGKQSQSSRRARDRGPGVVDLATADERRPSFTSGISDIPWGAFAVALVFAGLIGAAGGFVYAGIVPRRS